MVILVKVGNHSLDEYVERQREELNGNHQKINIHARNCDNLNIRDVAQFGSAPLWGSGGRGFKSRRSDKNHV
tara:strand:- start:387 stop:602 length:216 start_codon:yes stop_codon:yes gene_type:complete